MRNWIPLVIALVVYVTSCLGLGYLAGLWVGRRKWPGWVSVLMAFAVACLWPAIAVGAAMYDARRIMAEHPDAPGMMMAGVLYFVVPAIFFLGLPLALIGSFIARRRHSKGVAL